MPDDLTAAPTDLHWLTIADAARLIERRRLSPVELTDALIARVERSEEHTSELQSQSNLVCRLLLEKKNSTSSLSKSASTAIISWLLAPSGRPTALPDSTCSNDHPGRRVRCCLS